MSSFQFSILVLGLLVLPGPTNALFASLAARRGFAFAARRVPVALIGYGLGVTAIVIAATRFPPIGTMLILPGRIAIALYLGFLAYRLWMPATGKPERRSGAPSSRDLFATTLVNPKIVVLGYLLLAEPAGRPDYPVSALLIGSAIALAACLWAALGASASAMRNPRPELVERIASVIIAIAAVATLASAVRDAI